MRALKGLFVTLILMSLSRSAGAQEPIDHDLAGLPRSAEGSAQVVRLGAFVHAAALEARDARRAVVVTGLATGAALVPAGVTLWRRADPVSRSIGAGMTIGGAAPLAFSLISLLPSPMERLDRSLMERSDSGVNPDDLIRMTESDWRDASVTAHDRRVISGAIELGTGGVAIGAGLCLLLTRQIGGLSANGQQTLGSLFIGPGVPIFALGVRSLFQQTTVESAWTEYKTTRVPHADAANGFAGALSVAVLPHGILVGATLPL